MFSHLPQKLRTLLLLVVLSRVAMAFAISTTSVPGGLFIAALIASMAYTGYVSRRRGFAKALPWVLYVLGVLQFLAAFAFLRVHLWVIASLAWGVLAIWTAYSLQKSPEIKALFPNPA